MTLQPVIGPRTGALAIPPGDTARCRVVLALVPAVRVATSAMPPIPMTFPMMVEWAVSTVIRAAIAVVPAVVVRAVVVPAQGVAMTDAVPRMGVWVSPAVPAMGAPTVAGRSVTAHVWAMVVPLVRVLVLVVSVAAVAAMPAVCLGALRVLVLAVPVGAVAAMPAVCLGAVSVLVLAVSVAAVTAMPAVCLGVVSVAVPAVVGLTVRTAALAVVMPAVSAAEVGSRSIVYLSGADEVMNWGVAGLSG
jgi:hypothetical protein